MTPPVTILHEQAQFIARNTKGLIEGEVSTSKAGQNFLHQFFLVVPLLDNYTYRLFFVEHPLQLYPATLFAEAMQKQFQVATSEEFIERLREVLSSRETVKIVRALLAQSQGIAP